MPKTIRRTPNHGVEMGLYSYPILMTADILMFNAQEVPVAATKSNTSKWRATSPAVSTTASANSSPCPK